ncbi:MAG: diaminopimelate epimerase [Chitinophagales bacterium]
MNISFSKYHGTGNDFVMIDNRSLKLQTDSPAFYENLCHRRFGIGADGVIFLQNHPNYDFEMIYLNADGRPTSMCGNGGRCITAFAHQLGVEAKEEGLYNFLAIDGIHKGSIDKKGLVSLQMNDVTNLQNFNGDWVLDTGSPHYVQFVDNVWNIDIFSEGRAIRNQESFRKAGINVNFVQQLANGIHVATYERGVEDETFSCGTGVVAASIATISQNEYATGNYSVDIQTKGGKLTVSFEHTKEGHFCNVWLKGSAVHVFEGQFPYLK